MSRRIVAAVAVLLCIYLDSIFFARVNFMDVRPDALLAVTVSLSILAGGTFAAVACGVGGLLMDIFVGRYVGLSAALLIAAACSAGFFHKKYYADNIIVPSLSAVVLGILKEHVMLVFVVANGGGVQYGAVVLKYILPCALMTGALCALMHLVLKPLMLSQVRRNRAEKIG